MDFEKIILSTKQVKRLKQLMLYPEGLPRSKEDHDLINYRLIDSMHYINSDKTGTTVYRINTDGKEYLKWLTFREREKQSDRRHDWIIALFSVLAGAVLSRPLWETIDWIRSLFTSIP